MAIKPHLVDEFLESRPECPANNQWTLDNLHSVPHVVGRFLIHWQRSSSASEHTHTRPTRKRLIMRFLSWNLSPSVLLLLFWMFMALEKVSYAAHPPEFHTNFHRHNNRLPVNDRLNEVRMLSARNHAIYDNRFCKFIAPMKLTQTWWQFDPVDGTKALAYNLNSDYFRFWWQFVAWL